MKKLLLALLTMPMISHAQLAQPPGDLIGNLDYYVKGNDTLRRGSPIRTKTGEELTIKRISRYRRDDAEAIYAETKGFKFIPLDGIALSWQRENDSLITSCGYAIAPGTMLKIGTGALPDGDFKYIRVSATSLFQSTGNSRAYNNSSNSFAAGFGGMTYKVIRIDEHGDKKHGFAYYPIISQGPIRYQIDIDNAIAAGEVVVPDKFKPKPAAPVIIQQAPSAADELLKFKKLLDAGAITQDEYDAQKKKLLAQ